MNNWVILWNSGIRDTAEGEDELDAFDSLSLGRHQLNKVFLIIPKSEESKWRFNYDTNKWIKTE